MTEERYDAERLAQVQPPGWVNPPPAGRYNLVAVGAGTAGLVAAAGAAGVGAKVALVERGLMGGDCLNVGCVPSKALLRSARAAAAVRDAGRFGVVVPDGVRVDFAAVMDRMRQLRADLAPHDSAARFRGLGVDVFLGDGRFTGPDTVEVGGQTLRFRKAVIATGSRPFIPPIPGLNEAGFLTNETIFSLTELPPRLAVIGAGPIGCELAQAFARFGSQVTVIGNHPQILPREDREAAARVEASLRRDGVSFALGATIRRVSPSSPSPPGFAGGEGWGERGFAPRTAGPNPPHPNPLPRRAGREGARGLAKVIVLAGEPDREIVVDEILVATGRRPTVDGLALAAAGISFDLHRGVTVDDRLRTTNPRVYAAGDVCSKYKFTHAADATARIVVQNALFHGWAKASALTVPWCTYTDPEIAHVGLSEPDAKEQGIAYRVFTQEMNRVDRAVLDGEDEGFARLLVHPKKDRILGATIVSSHAGDLMAEVTLAMAGGLGLGTLAKTIHPYPTQAEALKKVADAYNRTRLTPTVKWLFDKWLSWGRS
jgi:pyruvate/2-oxoglutarate dehydrogenase complex dihydrolipoamide dehydrogenase (E3) component